MEPLRLVRRGRIPLRARMAPPLGATDGPSYSRLQEPAKEQGLAAIKTLRLVRDLRVAAQHADAAERLPGALGKLALQFPITDYGETWDQVRSNAVDALAGLRQAVDSLN